jgi:cytochrome c-type biogenesis protein CcmE
MNIKMVIGAIILLPVLAHLGYATANSTFANYYVTVDELAARSATSPARVGGAIVPGSIQWDDAARTMHFQIAGNNTKLDIVYRGPVPDSFRDGMTTIVDGSRTSSGVFVATSVAVRCPHQYLPAG